MSSAMELLTVYHEASKEIEREAAKDLHPDMVKEYGDIIGTSRELVSRCILSGDPRGLIFLLEEIVTLLMLIKMPVTAEYLRLAAHKLVRRLEKHGTL